MTFSSVVTELLALASPDMPSAATIKKTFAARATKVETGDENLYRPPWTTRTRGSSDIFLSFAGDVEGIAIWEDSRGWGAYAELAVKNGTRADLEKIVGALGFVPRNPDDFHSGETVAAYVERNGKHIRVFAELDKKDKTQLRKVTIHFEQ